MFISHDQACLNLQNNFKVIKLNNTVVSKGGHVLCFYNCTFAQLSFCVHSLFICHFTFHICV